MAIVKISCGRTKVDVRVTVDSSMQIDTRDVIDLCNQFAEELDKRIEARAEQRRTAASAAPLETS